LTTAEEGVFLCRRPKLRPLRAVAKRPPLLAGMLRSPAVVSVQAESIVLGVPERVRSRSRSSSALENGGGVGEKSERRPSESEGVERCDLRDACVPLPPPERERASELPTPRAEDSVPYAPVAVRDSARSRGTISTGSGGRIERGVKSSDVLRVEGVGGWGEGPRRLSVADGRPKVDG
jgi:hypothetical protein